MSDGRFYRWVHDSVMGRRGTLSLLVGIALGWTGATVTDDVGPTSADGTGNESGPDAMSDERAGGTASSSTGEPATTTTSGPTTEGTASPEPTPAAETTATATPEATATSTPDGGGLEDNLDVSPRGFGDGTSYQVIYSILNQNDVAVVVTFEATVSLQNGETLRKEKTATINPGQAATDEFVFEDYDSSPTGWGFQVQSVSRV